jgi:DNA-binding CsgD family transcriptional regulator
MRQYERLLDVIDLTYQAALEPEVWPDVFDAVAGVLGAERSVLLSRPGGRPTGLPSSRLDPAAVTDYLATFEAINPIQEQISRRPADASMVFTDQECLPKRDLQHSDFFTDFMRPTRMHAFLLIRFQAPHTAALNVIRGARDGDFDARELEVAKLLQRPLTRAYNMALRLGDERRMNEGLTDFVERLPSAVFLLGANGSIAYASPSGETLIAANDGLFAVGRTLKAWSPEAQRRLALLIGQAASPDEQTRVGGAIALPRPSGRRPLTASVAPARGEAALSSPRGPYALVSVADPDAEASNPQEQLRDLFGFTPAEARVAAEFIDGRQPADIAERLGLSLHTVRVQIARIRAKTDTRHQGEFIALMTRALAGHASPRPRGVPTA